MFSTACAKNREAIYGVLCTSVIAKNRASITNGTAFMIAPGVLATAAHVVHIQSDPTKQVHSSFEVIRAPDVGSSMETATFLAEDSSLDLALLKIQAPRSTVCLNLATADVPRGTTCGSLGFPLAQVGVQAGKKKFNLLERFQGAYISAVNNFTNSDGSQVTYYETDALMYEGSSGCPGFTTNGEVVGMHVKSLIQGKKTGSTTQEMRLAISLWVRSPDIISFATTNAVNI